MITENQNTPGPDDLSDDTAIATIQEVDSVSPLGEEVSELDDVEEVNTPKDYNDDDIDDMSDES